MFICERSYNAERREGFSSEFCASGVQLDAHDIGNGLLICDKWLL